MLEEIGTVLKMVAANVFSVYSFDPATVPENSIKDWLHFK